MSGVTLGKTEDEILAAVVGYDHWPLEVSLTPAALKHVENALKAYIGFPMRPIPVPDNVHAELWNTSNIIRAHLQHVVEDARIAASKPDVSDLI